MRPADFGPTVRRGARAGRPTLVVHCRLTDRAQPHVGFVVSRAVGGAVTRNLVRRRLRGLVVEHVDTLPAGADIVVRALTPAARADYASIARDLRSALSTVARRSGRSAQ